MDSLQSAIAAVEGGADRIELCSSLNEGGLTPSAACIELTRKYLDVEINVMIRPRSGDFCYSELEYEIMKRDIEIAMKLGADGIVIGILTEEGEVHIERMKEIVSICGSLNVTFHRAFDMTKNPYKALEDIKKLKIHRILTSGQKSTAVNGIELIKELVNMANDQVILMPGCGINEDNAFNIIEYTGAKEIHLSGRKKVHSKMKYRNSKVFMGAKDFKVEYENYFTDSSIIKSVKNACIK